jgi:hypothetical protein
VTKYKTYKEDTLLESAFEAYTKRHYETWVKFARDKQYGNDIQPVLVSGFDMTRDFAMAAYSNEDTSLEADLTITVPTLASASASIWVAWRTRCSPHTNYGPQHCIPPLREQAADPSSSRLAEAGSIPNGFNQSVFIRYYTMRPRKLMPMFPKVIRAGAGPHDLGSGDNRGDTFPELMARSDADLEPDIVVRNTPYV